MDPFTQSMLQKAEKRAAALGISGTTKFPLQEYNQEPAPRRESPRKVKPTVSPRQKTNTIIKQTYEADNDADVNVEINIRTAPNVQVEVDVKECEIDAQGNVKQIETKEMATDTRAAIRDSSKNQLQRLGTLYSETQDLSSPIHRTEGRFHEEIKENSKPKPKLARLAILADSINNWEDDTSHPDYRHHRETIYNTDSPKKTGAIPKKYPAPAPPKSILSPSKKDTRIDDNMDKTTKQLKWDQKVMDALESQGFQRCETKNPKLVYEYKDDEKNKKGRAPDVPDASKPAIEQINKVAKPAIEQINKAPKPAIEQMNKVVKPAIEQRPAPNPPAAKKPDLTKKGLVSGRTAMFESNKNSRKSIARNQKDPAEMSLKERMAIFEKNKGMALVPKAAFGMAAPIKSIAASSESSVKSYSTSGDSKIGSYNRPALAESKASGSGIKNAVAALMSGGQTIAETKIVEETKRQRQEEMDLLLNRFNSHVNSNKEEVEIPEAPPLPPTNFLGSNSKNEAHKRRSSDSPNDSPDVRSALEDVKRIRVQPPKSGRLYPALSDIETESDADNYTTASISESDENFDEKKRLSEDSFMMDSDDGICNISLGREILQVVQNNESKSTKTPKRVSINTQSLESSHSEISEIFDDMDDYLDEALEDSEESDTPKKGSISSNSFSYQKNPHQMRCHTIDEEESDDQFATKPIPKEDYCSPVRSELTVNNSDDNNMVTLVHTVSFYRRQQNSQNNTPIRKVFREQKFNQESTTEDSDDGSSSTSNEESALVQDKVKKLLDEVCKQQAVISQTSQALNLCAATIEFSGSAESVEGERHLLVATHRRQALLDEVSRLRVEGCLRPSGAPTEKGRLIIKEITVPLKHDYQRKLASETISGHQLVCLLKYNENVLATRTVPTLPGLLSVKFPDVLQLNNVYADFKITMEIYGMTAQREVLPHEIKYHIGLSKKSKLSTPKGHKSNSRLHMPSVQSPAGPQAVRTPALVQYGFIIFSLKEIQRTSWTLNPVAGVSPLEGTVHMKVNCELTVTVDYRGFLTMFEDVSGFGAWHRRWCRLNGHILSYWRYPDDEKKKTPIGSLNLKSICTQKVTVAPRDVCARLNTLLLESKRPSQDNDIESLVLVKKGNTTVVRYLLSADSKEEREEWCAQLNKTLTLLRAWGHSSSN